MNHTKGPWIFDERFHFEKVLADDQTKYHRLVHICTIEHYPQRPGEDIANAKLIAAAPEMLQALIEAKEVLLQLDNRHNGKCYNPVETDCKCTLCKINNAIQKTI